VFIALVAIGPTACIAVGYSCATHRDEALCGIPADIAEIPEDIAKKRELEQTRARLQPILDAAYERNFSDIILASLGGQAISLKVGAPVVVGGDLGEYSLQTENGVRELFSRNEPPIRLREIALYYNGTGRYIGCAEDLIRTQLTRNCERANRVINLTLRDSVVSERVPPVWVRRHVINADTIEVINGSETLYARVEKNRKWVRFIWAFNPGQLGLAPVEQAWVDCRGRLEQSEPLSCNLTYQLRDGIISDLKFRLEGFEPSQVLAWEQTGAPMDVLEMVLLIEEVWAEMVR